MSWPTVALGEAVTFKGGGTPSRGDPGFWNGPVPWATVKDLNSGYELRTTQESITQEGLRRSASNLIPAGTLVIPTRMALGKAVVAETDLAINQDLKAVFPVKNLDTRFLLWFFIANSSRIEAMGKGATVKGVTLDQLRSLEIPLPPLDEQRRIAAILDKADALRAKRREAIAKLDQLLQSVFLDMFGDPVSNPKQWKSSSLKDSKAVVKTGPFGSLLHKEDYISGGIPLINPMHIVDGAIRPGVEQTVSAEKATDLEGYRLLAGDVVMGRRGEMGRCAVVSESEAGMLCGTGSLLIRLDGSTLVPVFLRTLLSSRSMRLHLEGLSQGVTMANLNGSMIEGLRIILPPTALQQQFSRITAFVGQQMHALQRAAGQLDALFDSLQHRAFSGTL